MRALRALAALVMAAGIQPVLAGTASAAPPANDEYGGAIALNLGDRVEQDTTAATTTANDAALNEDCGAPETNASVWYSYTPTADTNVVLDMTESDYSGGFLVFEGTPSPESLIDCGAGSLGLAAQAGTTYYVMVISDTATNGGHLVLSLKQAPPAPRVNVTVARRGLAYRNGAARLHGTYKCSRGDEVDLWGTLRQRAGRLKITGYLEKFGPCDGSRHNWSARVVSDNGYYAPGRARAEVTIEACGLFECSDDSAGRQVRLVSARQSGGQRPAPLTSAQRQQPHPLVEQQQHWPGS